MDTKDFVMRFLRQKYNDAENLFVSINEEMEVSVSKNPDKVSYKYYILSFYTRCSFNKDVWLYSEKESDMTLLKYATINPLYDHTEPPYPAIHEDYSEDKRHCNNIYLVGTMCSIM